MCPNQHPFLQLGILWFDSFPGTLHSSPCSSFQLMICCSSIKTASVELFVLLFSSNSMCEPHCEMRPSVAVKTAGHRVRDSGLCGFPCECDIIFHFPGSPFASLNHRSDDFRPGSEKWWHVLEKLSSHGGCVGPLGRPTGSSSERSSLIYAGWEPYPLLKQNTLGNLKIVFPNFIQAAIGWNLSHFIS